MIGNVDEFYIIEFCYDNVFYEQVNVLVKVKEIYDYVINTVDNILKEVYSQVPNCLDNSQRIQEIKFKMQVQKNESGDKIDFITFYIEVENDLSELPSKIKVYPLIIKPNGEMYSFDFSIAMGLEQEQILDCMTEIGDGKCNGSWRADDNHRIILWLPLGIAWVERGNHSIATGIIQGKGMITASTYDISAVYDYVECDGLNYYRKEDKKIIADVKNVEFAAIFEIERMMKEYSISY